MAYLEQLKINKSDFGNLLVFENLLPGAIKRVYYITDVPADVVRGKHRHHNTWQALICISGTCRVYVHNGEREDVYHLSKNDSCLILAPNDWHFMDSFSENAVLLVLANEYYNVKDYIDEPYSNSYENFLYATP
jgi:dTDP-4-dehydrorhamnose 3,5-epimerase-like enzyme